jgi:hypothetical protein
MAYWGEVHRRAFEEARELVRLDRRGRVFVTLSTIILPAVAAYAATPKFDPVLRALASAGALLFAGVAIYAWKLLSVPAHMAAEDRQRSEAAAAAAAQVLEDATVAAAKRESELLQTITDSGPRTRR